MASSTIPVGTTVRLVDGVRFGLRDDSDAEAQGLESWQGWSHHIAGQNDDSENDLIVEYVGGSHSTMNGGGRDYTLRCPHSYLRVSVRTTLSQPESATFRVQA